MLPWKLCSCSCLCWCFCRLCVDILVDPTCLFGTVALLLLIKVVDFFITFSHKHNVFMCDFIGAIKVCEGQLYSLYNCCLGVFNNNKFFIFKNLLKGTHNLIHTRWVSCDPKNVAMFDLNCETKDLDFAMNANNVFVKGNVETCAKEFITQDVYAIMVEDVKKQCASTLIQPRFPFFRG